MNYYIIDLIILLIYIWNHLEHEIPRSLTPHAYPFSRAKPLSRIKANSKNLNPRSNAHVYVHSCRVKYTSAS